MSWDQVLELITSILVTQTGIPNLAVNQVMMIGIGLFFIYLAVAKEYEPLLLVPIGFGIFIVNFPLTPLMGFTEHGNPELIRFSINMGWNGRSFPV